MCGVAGITRTSSARVDERALRCMARALRHRGPDGFGIAVGPGVGFVSTRLAIVDIPGGWQPICDSPGGGVIVYNGEVYNAPELRASLARSGVGCRTRSDTEAVLRLLELQGLSALDSLNGQFAFAWWQPRQRQLTLVRDRFGVRPLYYALTSDGSLVFASETKAIFASGEVLAEPDLAGVDDVFTLWGARAPSTPFRGVRQVRAGGLAIWRDGRIEERTWWRPRYGRSERRSSSVGELTELLRDSVRLRLRADVPVGSYLSGGLDSSLLTALALQESEHRLRTFSVAFRDGRFDERSHQQHVAAALGTEHHVVEIGPDDIADAFRDVVYHCETPLVRTAPVPLYLLARETRDQGITVVATGEGADELYWGYDLFKELVIRREALYNPSAVRRLDDLYPYLATPGARRGPGWTRFFTDAGPEEDTLFSHQTRIAATAAVKRFYAPDMAAAVGRQGSLDRLRAALPAEFACWSALEKGAYLELTTLLEPYLLAAQGDRVSMAYGVEGRYPFLDYRVFEHSVRLPAARKLVGDRDKVALREVAQTLLPPEIAERPKHPYRAPEVDPFVRSGKPLEWVDEALSARALDAVGIFDPTRVAGLVARCRAGRASGPREGMAFVAVLSTQVWFNSFCGPDRVRYQEETSDPKARLHLGRGATPEDVE